MAAVMRATRLIVHVESQLLLMGDQLDMLHH